MIFGEADGEGEVPEAWGYAAAESADRARGGGCRPIVGPERLLGQGQVRVGRAGRGASRGDHVPLSSGDRGGCAEGRPSPSDGSGDASLG